MRIGWLHGTDIALIASLFVLAAGTVSLRFHSDFFAGLGIAAGVTMIMMAAWKRQRAGIS